MHKNNTDLGLDLGLKFTPSGRWTNSSGNKAYDIGTTNNGYISPVSPMALLTQLNGAMPKSTQQIAAEGQARQFNAINESASESLKNAGQWLKDNTIAGVTGASAALTKTADLLLPNIPYLQDYFEWNANYADEQKAKATETNSKGGTASSIVGEIYQAGVQMIPSAIAALASGGSSTASQIGQAGSSVANLLQSPAYWTSFAQTAGPEYYNAKAKGANELQASLTGMTSGAVGGAIERMGGIDTLLGNKAQGVLRTAAEEAGEEVLQDITSGLINKTAYDHEREWFGTGDSDAVINPQRLAMNAGAGAILGGAVSGVNAIIGHTNNTIGNAKQAVNNPDSPVVDVKIDGQSVNDIEVPTLRTVAENHINNTISDVNPIRVGKATTIQKPYNGKTPVASQQNLNRQSIHIDNNLLNNAQTIIDDAKQSQTFAKNIKTALKNIFQQSGGSRLVTVDNLYFDGKNYSVSIPARVFSKVASDHSMSSEKLAAFSKLDEIISTAQYVGSGHYNKNKNKAANVIRYDYFENLLDINNQNYIVTFDVEVFRDTNNFRTYRVINEIDLTPTAASRRSKTDGLTTAVSGLSDSIISHNYNQHNTAMSNGNSDVTPPTLLTVAENHINESIANAQNAQNASLLSNQPLQNNTSVNVENMTSDTPLQVPTLRTVAENHINEVIAQNTQNATNSQSSVQPQTVGQIIDNAIADSQANTNKSKIDIDETSSETITNDLLASWQEVKALDKQIAAFEERVKFTGNDLRQIESSLLSGDTSTLYRADNPQDAQYMVELKSKRNAARQPIDDYRRQYQDKLWLEATEDAEMFFRYAKDKVLGLQYATETPERNIYDIFGKKFRAYAEDFIKRYYVPVHKAVAKGNQLKNKFRDRVRSLNLTQEESVLTQYLLEGKTEDYNQYISSRKIELSKEQNLKISKAVVEFREIYDELFRMINEAEVRNGLEPTNFRQFYAPHFTEKLSDHILARALNRIGFAITKKDQIPTSISGITENFRPKKQYFKHLQRRTGDQTVVDAVRGFDQYIDTACDVITLTDSIQRFRQLEDAIRYQFTDASMKKLVEKVMADDTLSYLQRQQKLDEIYEKNTSNAERINNLSGCNMGLRNFVAQLRKYTDNLAGKKSRGDRSIEDDTNRTVYEVSKQVQSRVSANMIAGNISSWLTNVIPLTQATGEIDLSDLFRGMRDTIRAYIKDDGFVDGSAFLTNRRGSKNIIQTKVQKVGDILGTPMEIIDHFVADSIVRARTHQNIKKGMDYNAAIDEADAMAASLMADRSKGATPEIFNRQDPKVKLFTTFQIEVNNQLRYLGKDIPRRLGEQGAVAVGKALTSIFVGAYLYNELYEKLTGRRAALDPAGMIKSTLNIIDNEDAENSDKIYNVATLYAQQLPFVGGLLGGGRLPISAALPDVGNLLTAFNSNVPTKKRVDIIAGELANPAAYLLLPFGGGAIKKGIEGFNLIQNKGAYRVNDDGDDELMFAANGNAPTDYLQAMLFGKYSGENGQNYINSGFKVLSSDYTKMYKQLVDTYGVNNNTAYDSLMNVYTTQAKAGGERKPNQRLALMNTDLPAEAKEHIDRFLFRSNSDENIIDYSDKAHFDITMNVKHKYLDNALYLHDELGVDGDATVKLIRNSMFGSTDNLGKKNEQIYTIIDNINKMNVSDDIKNYAFSEIVAPQISEKYVSEQGKQLLSGIPMDLAMTSYYQRDIINEEIDNDNTIHPLDKDDYKKLGWQNYLDEYATEFGLSFEQKENLRYFLANGQSTLERDWDYYSMKGGEDVRPLVEQFKNSGLDVLKYQVIKSGMDQIYSDKNADGTPVDGSKKAKLIAYLDNWGLDDNTKNLMLMADDYKYGLYEKPSSSKKKSSSSKKSSGGRNSKPKVKGGFSDFSGF